MAHLADVLAYISGIYQSKQGPARSLRPDRAIMLAYLSDWRSAIRDGHQISDVRWEMVDFEPRLDNQSLPEILRFAERKNSKVLARLRVFFFGNGLTHSDQQVVRSVVSDTLQKTDEQLRQIVHSTYPALTRGQEDLVDLNQLAKAYKSLHGEILPQSPLAN